MRTAPACRLKAGWDYKQFSAPPAVNLLFEVPHKRASFPAIRPRHAQPWSLIAVSHSHGGHRVAQLGQRWIERCLVSAGVIFVAQAARLDGGNVAGPQEGVAMV